MIETLLGSALTLPPIRPVAVVATAVAKIMQQLWTKLGSERWVGETVSRIFADAILFPSHTVGAGWNLVAVSDACQAATVLFAGAYGEARTRSSHLLPALRLATTIAVKRYPLFGTSPNNSAPARSGKTPAGA